MAGSTATSPAPDALSPSGSTPAPGLEGQVSTAGATAGTDEQARINALMSKWQKSDAEVARLQGLLATAVATEAALKATVTELEQGQQGKTAEVEQQLTESQSRVAELETQVATLTAENTRLLFITQNLDIAAYSAILPVVSDTAALEKAAQTIRQARTAEQDRMRTHLSTPPAGGQTPRKPQAALTPSEIDAYLRNAPPGEFEQRLAEVTGRL